VLQGYLPVLVFLVIAIGLGVVLLAIGLILGNGQKSQEEEIRDNISIKAVVSKSSPYQGEQLTLTYKLYTRLDILNYNLTKSPSFTGFWSQDIELPGQIQLTQEVLDGEAYRVGTLKKVALFPQRTGELVIDPMETEFAVRIKTKRKRRSVFDDFFNDPFFGFNTQTVNVKVLSNKLKIKSKALPAQNRPSTFDGAVGSFKLETFLDNHETKTNEPVTLTIKLSGSGNIKLLDQLNIEFPPTIEVYDPKINDAVSKKKNIISGRKTFEYLLIPRHEGEHVIRPFTFSYFDPNKRDYISIASPEFIIRAAKGDEIVSSGIISGFRKEEIELIGEDIRFIKTNPVDFVTEFPPLLGSTKFYVLTISPLVLFFLFLFIWNKYEESMSNILLVKSRKANKMAKKRLSIADKYLKEKDKEKFYEEVSKALWGYISDRLVIQAADLSKDVIQTNLGQKNIAEELINKFTSTIDHCELARYSPTGNPVEMENVYKDSIQLITDIEEELKKA